MTPDGDEKRMLVKDIMITDVIVLKADDDIGSAIKALAEHNISGAPVVDGDGKVVGMVTETDIFKALRARFKELKMVYPSIPLMGITFEEVPRDTKLANALEEINRIPLAQVMSTKLSTVTPDNHVGEAVQAMHERDINRLPVIAGEKLVGLVSRGDIIKHAAALF